jgi:hypothetical protein
MIPQPSPHPRRLRHFADARLRASFVGTAVCGAALALGTAALVGARAGFSAAIGTAVAEANLWALAQIVSALLQGQHAGAWGVVAPLKMFALVAVVGVMMRYTAIAPLFMVVGFGALPMGIAIGSLMSDRSAPSED